MKLINQIVCITPIFLLFSCIGNNGVYHSEVMNDETVKVVFHNFFNRNVILKINNEKVLDSYLTVKSPSNGISHIANFLVKDDNIFELKFDGIYVKKRIQINSSVRLIYINPTNEPFIKLSNSEIILLD